MPEYSQIQTYVQCDKDSFNLFLAQMKLVLADVGFSDDYMINNFLDLKWETNANGFMYSACNMAAATIDLFGVRLCIRPLMLGWPPEQNSWVDISLLFKTNEIADRQSRIKEEVKLPLWNAMLLLSGRFDEAGVFLTDETTDSQSWRAMLEEGQDIWCFDAAIIPDKAIVRYKLTDSRFSMKKDGGRLWVTNKSSWGKAPWQ